MKLILRSPDGRFFEVEESLVSEYEVKPEDLPAGALDSHQGHGQGGNGYGANGPQGGAPQVVIYTMGGVPMGGQQPPPPGGQQQATAAPPAEQGEKSEGGDVEPRQWFAFSRWSNWANWGNWGNWGNWASWRNW